MSLRVFLALVKSMIWLDMKRPLTVESQRLEDNALSFLKY